jgi:hypothetical protein
MNLLQSQFVYNYPSQYLRYQAVWVNQTLNNETMFNETSTAFTISTPYNELLDCLNDSVLRNSKI